jgi:hypothetical protein
MRGNGYRLESLMLAVDLAYEAFSAMMWRRIELWKLGTIDRAVWPEDYTL